VERFSSGRARAVFEALRAAPGAEEGLIRWPDGAAVLAGGEVRTREGAAVVVYGPPAEIAALAGDHLDDASLVNGFRPAHADLVAAADARRLLLLARAGGRAHAMRRVDGLLVGPERSVPRALARAHGLPIAGGSGARRTGELGMRRTALALDEPSFASVRRAFAEQALTVFGDGGAIAGAVRECAAAAHGLLERLRRSPTAAHGRGDAPPLRHTLALAAFAVPVAQ
jgi:hypothetical protein